MSAANKSSVSDKEECKKSPVGLIRFKDSTYETAKIRKVVTDRFHPD
jgi:hypothetical protein